MVKAGEELGVRYVTGAEALSVEGVRGRATAVVTSAGHVECDEVVIACGADSRALLTPLGINVASACAPTRPPPCPRSATPRSRR
ncbi:FAD-dependent oxidoreductase [Nonomuraea sp. NPDC049158]|uniref:FAD-dependent oxidoreductase n=1 Tax=Nonomuraea sp. NPDC049158 TaxID=3155649 RepID=UPI0033CA3A63